MQSSTADNVNNNDQNNVSPIWQKVCVCTQVHSVFCHTAVYL